MTNSPQISDVASILPGNPDFEASGAAGVLSPDASPGRIGYPPVPEGEACVVSPDDNAVRGKVLTDPRTADGDPFDHTLDADHPEAHQKAADCARFLELTRAQHYSGNQASAAIGRSPAWFSVNIPRWQRAGVAAFLPKRRAPGAGRQIFLDLPEWFIPAARFFWLITNRTREGGSIPDAIERVISLPVIAPANKSRLLRVLGVSEMPQCPEALREQILARKSAGTPMLPESLTRQIPSGKAVVQAYRNKKNAKLNFTHAPGSAMWLSMPNGERRFIKPGDVFEGDDATINFPLVVPWEMGGCPCSEKFGVKVARFQWLVFVDVGSRLVVGWSYTARPKSSYRAEDIVATQKGIVTQHGIPRHWRLEQGAWASKLVQQAITNMGSQAWPVYSPHSKPFIEGLFNKLWTKLSVWFPDAEVGRFRGENDEASKLLTASQSGARDPRLYFPPLKAVIEAFAEVIAEHNTSLIRSDNYGQWIPAERWERAMAERPLRHLDAGSEWMFAPFCETWTIQGQHLGGKVRVMDRLSVPFQFSAPWLAQFTGAKARAYFDPNEPRCFAKICLAQPWLDHPAGAILGDAIQVNETTQYIRMVMGHGDDPRSAGQIAAMSAQRALRREVRAVVGRKSPNPYSVYAETETRDGLGAVTKATISGEVCNAGKSQHLDTASQECGEGQDEALRPSLAEDSSLRFSPENPGRGNSAAGVGDQPDPADALEKERPELFV